MISARSVRAGVLLACLPRVAVAEPAPAPASAPRPDALATREAVHYRIEQLPLPEGVVLEVGGLDFAPDGTLYVATRRGEIWALTGAATSRPRWRRFASGLHEALGVLAQGHGDLIVAQRPELTRVRDRDRDGRADSFESLTQAFGLSGNYHEYHFGPVRDHAGNLYATLNLAWVGHGASPVPYRGWLYRLSPDGVFTPLASGFRSPAGIGLSPDGDLFVTDNQGDWWATSPLLHVEPGGFHGHPAGLRWEPGYTGPDDAFDLPPERFAERRRAPAAWFVYGPLGHSPSEPVWDTRAGGFGPFAGQMLIGDQTRSLIVRAALEKVGGRYQGALIPFRHGFASGILRMRFGRDGKLYVGGTDRGWGAVGGRPFALERLAYTGVAPFEIHVVRAAPDGFVVVFTQSIDPDSARAEGAVRVVHHRYHYWKTYGSEHVEVTPVAPVNVAVAPDARSLRITLPELPEGRVYTLGLPGVRARDGAPLLHDTAYYTLNVRPAALAAEARAP